MVPAVVTVVVGACACILLLLLRNGKDEGCGKLLHYPESGRRGEARWMFPLCLLKVYNSIKLQEF